MKSFPTILFALSLAAAPATQAGSLWLRETNNEESMYSDQTAKNIGDVITIVVSESAVVNQAQEIKTYDNSQNGMGIWVSNLLNQFLVALPGIVSNSTGASTKGFDMPTLDLGAKSEFQGGGNITNRQTVTARTAVTVVDKLPNGNLVIEGTKIIRGGKETQYARLRGIVRPMDVQRDNTVLSTNIADAQIEYVPAGELTEAQKKAWGIRAWDAIKPF
jgi:flagellar L-ring protein precursor FlgH